MDTQQDAVMRVVEPRRKQPEHRKRQTEWLGRNVVRYVESFDVKIEAWDGPHTEHRTRILGEVTEPVS